MHALRIAVREKLQATLVSELQASSREMVIIDAHQDLQTAFQTLVIEGISSAPVQDSHSPPHFVGFLDLASLISSVVRLYDNNDLVAHGAGQAEDLVLNFHPTSPFAELRADGSHHAHSIQVNSWSPGYMARLFPFQSCTADATLLSVCEKMAQGVKRVVALDANHNAERVISQSWVINTLFDLVAADLPDLPVASLGLTLDQVLFVSETDPAIDSFRVMDRLRVSGVPILRENRVVGQLTASDLSQFLVDQDVTSLSRPIRQFVQKELSNAQGELLSIKLSDPIVKMFATFFATKSHRLFVVNDAGEAIGVCSLKDVLKNLLNT
eukprot:c3708_g1_i1.p1 GENE.c3708_g1_i1~~c3708_g1_i1.p1  ORF type:complete len:325 (+),score=85.96 c3708_g1_i1:58-1032(+)